MCGAWAASAVAGMFWAFGPPGMGLAFDLLLLGLVAGATAMGLFGCWLCVALQRRRGIRTPFVLLLFAAVPAGLAAGGWLGMLGYFTLTQGAGWIRGWGPGQWLAAIGFALPFPVEVLTVLLWIFRRRRITEPESAA